MSTLFAGQRLNIEQQSHDSRTAWVAASNCTVALAADADAARSPNHLAVTLTADGDAFYLTGGTGSDKIAVTPGEVFRYSRDFFTSGSVNGIGLQWKFYDSAGTALPVISEIMGDEVLNTWVTLTSKDVTVPDGAARLDLVHRIFTALAAEVHPSDNAWLRVVNRVPTANAGPDQAVSTDALVGLDGSASSDPDGKISAYNWSLTVPTGSKAALSGTGPTRTFTADVAGTYTGTLTVTDDFGSTSTADTVTVTATKPPESGFYIARLVNDSPTYLPCSIHLGGGYLTRGITYDAIGGKVRAEQKVFTDWLAANKVRGFVGEVGIPGSSSAGTDTNHDPAWAAQLDAWYAGAHAAGVGVVGWNAAEWNVQLRQFRNPTGDNAPLSITTTAGAVVERWPGSGRGVNLAGPEFGDSGPSGHLDPRPGTAGVQYYYPAQGSWEFLANRGVKLVRLPVRWERLQPTLKAPLDAAEVGRLDQALAWAAQYGLRVIIDQHNYGRYAVDNIAANVLRLGDPAPTAVGGTLIECFVDFWQRMATAYKGRAGLDGYCLTNEPHTLPLIGTNTQGYETWQDASRKAVEAIRAIDHASPAVLYVNGYNYANIHAWPDLNGATAWLYDTIPAGQPGAGSTRNTDPSIRFEAHHYFDINRSGTYADTYAATLTDAQNRGYVGGTVVVNLEAP